MEDINDEILAMENKRVAIREELEKALKAKVNSNNIEETNKKIHILEQSLENISAQLNKLYDIAVDLAKAAACEFFQDDDCQECYLY